ncbi:MAG TPA: nitronate monooxygenase [Methyloceanibacter sp.]|nr:nitronate monooxygenase [Methyloceanibacter sp.]
MLAADKIYSGVTEIRSHIDRPINLNFFCHVAPQRRGAQADLAQSVMHLTTPSLAPRRRHSHSTQGLCPSERTFAASSIDLRSRAFKFGLPALDLLQHVKAAGCRVLNSATSVREARWLYENGADVVIAQGAEAGGHRGMFIEIDVDTQIETFALVPQIVDAVPVPVIAACGIADARGVAAAFALGAAGVQIGTAYLRAPEVHISELHRAALKKREPATVITNVLSGRPARVLLNRFIKEQGPIASEAPAFPLATHREIFRRSGPAKPACSTAT